ncbi:AraC family transcriptional regulator [Lacticaseibacillus sp. GG6-2]
MRLLFNSPDFSLPLFVDSIGYDWDQYRVDRPNGYPYYHWLQSNDGQGAVTIGSTCFTLQPGEGFLIAANIPHAYAPVTPKWNTSYFTFGGALVNELTSAIGLHEFAHITQPSREVLQFTRISYQTISKQADNIDLNASPAVYEFLLALRPYLQADSPTNTNTHRIAEAVLSLIQNHYADNLNNQAFATATNYSIQYVLQCFQSTYHQTPKQYLNTYRIKKAKELLISQPTLPLAAVATNVGFSTENYLIQVFKHQENLTPGQFRTMFQ